MTYKEPSIGNFTLRYECECGRRTPEYRKNCQHCGRENPDYTASPSFIATPISKKSIIDARERQLKRNIEKLGEE